MGEYALVDIDPPAIGQPFGLGNKDLTSLILAVRWQGTSFERNYYPMPVLIYRILEAVEGKTIVSESDVRMEAWGEVYLTREGAEHAGDPSSVRAWSRHAKR